MTPGKPGRNDACPCGSGKKYKRCCGGIETGGRVTKGARSGSTNPPLERFSALLIEQVARGNEQVVALMRSIELWAAKFNEIYGKVNSEFAVGDTLKEEKATIIEVLQVQVGFFQVLAGKRVAELLAEIIHALNRRRLYVAALATRAFVETAAAVIYCEAKVSPALTSGIGTQEQLDELMAFLDQIATAGRFDWARWLPGGEPRESLKRDYANGLDPRASRQQVNVMTMLKALDRRLTALSSESRGMIRLAYDILCDICHPSVGGYIFHLATASKPGWLAIGGEVTAEQLRWYCGNTTVPLVDSVARLAARALSDLTHITKSLRQEEQG